MTIKERIQADFVKAMKERNEVAKLALSGIKAMITEAEKANGNKPLTEADTIKVISKAIKNRKASADEYAKFNRPDLAFKELAEVDVLNKYMPEKMRGEELKKKIKEIYESLSNLPSETARKGKTMGEFNRLYNGRADMAEVKQIIETL